LGGAAGLTVAGVLTATSLDISGDIDVDGTTNLDVVDIDGAVDMASTLTVAGVLTGASLDISGDIDVDGTTNLDIVDIDGAVDMASTLQVDGALTVSGATNALSPIAVRNATQSFNGGLSAEVNTSIMNFGLNEGSANRFGGSYTQASQGGMLHFDTRSGEPLFQLYGRAAGAAGATGTLLFQIDSTGNTVFNETGADADFRVESDGNANMLFVDGGNNRVGIGNAAPSTTLEVTGSGDAETGITVTHSRSGVGNTILLNNTNNGANKGSGIKWQSGGFDTAAIITRSDAEAASGDAPAYMTFHTSTDGSEDLAERIRIISNGNTKITSTTHPLSLDRAGQDIAGQVEVSANGTAAAYWGANSSALLRVGNNAFTQKMLVDHSGNLTTAGSVNSDRDLKENIADIPNGSLALIKQLQPRTFNFLESFGFGTESRTGFIAQEVSDVFTTDNRVATGTDGESNMGVDPLGMIAHLTKAMQEQQAIIESLTARIEALEAV